MHGENASWGLMVDWSVQRASKGYWTTSSRCDLRLAAVKVGTRDRRVSWENKQPTQQSPPAYFRRFLPPRCRTHEVSQFIDHEPSAGRHHLALFSMLKDAVYLYIRSLQRFKNIYTLCVSRKGSPTLSTVMWRRITSCEEKDRRNMGWNKEENVNKFHFSGSGLVVINSPDLRPVDYKVWLSCSMQGV